MIADEELKNRILQLVGKDESFTFESHRLVLGKYGNNLVTKTCPDKVPYKPYIDFDKKLSKLSEELRKEFYKAPEKLSEEFDKKLSKQSEEFKKEFYAALEKQSEEFDKKLLEQSRDLKDYISAQIGSLGQRWSIRAEESISNFARKLVKKWEGKVTKWRKEILIEIGNSKIIDTYETDIVITNGEQKLAEVKPSCGTQNVIRFLKAVNFYEEETGVKGREKNNSHLYITKEAKQVALQNGVNIINSLGFTL